MDQFFKPTTTWSSGQAQNKNSGLFQLNLLALAATVIKADGEVKAQELQFVRNFFITNYGSDRATSIFEKFNEEIKKEKLIY